MTKKKEIKKLPERESDYKSKKKKTPFVEVLLNFVAWASGFLVSIAVGYAMIGGTLTLPSLLGGEIVSNIVGWIVIVTTVLSVVLSFFRK
jgi:hypothetical protein